MGQRVVPVRTAEELKATQELFSEYARIIGELHGEICLAAFAEELRGLPGAYAPENEGDLWIAYGGDQLSGCVALKQIEPGLAELKRLYVRRLCRGHGLGRELVRAVVQEATRLGYSRLCLETLPVMIEARGLYTSIGFREVPANGQAKQSEAIYMTLDLDQSAIS